MRTLALIASLALGTACSKQAERESLPAPAEPATTAAAQEPEPVNPHGANPYGANPHGANPHGANPHGAGYAAASKDDRGRYGVGALTLETPDDWTSLPVSSRMRKAQFELPAADGDTGSTELVVYHFGNAGAGSVQDNLDRWYGQFEQADGSDTKSRAKTDTVEIAGMQVTTVDVSGRYVAEVAPGAGATHDKPEHRMLAAIVQAPDGAYYFKLVGPEKSVAAQRDAFAAAIRSIEPVSTAAPGR